MTPKAIHPLFEPITIGKTPLKNRIVMAPMTRNRSDDEQHLANGLMAEYYGQRTGAGLIISEGIFVSPAAAGYIRVPGLYTKEQTASWKQVTDTVHHEGGKIFAQLWHTGRISHPDFHRGRLPLAPSAINPRVETYTKYGRQDTVTPKAMSPEEINATIADFKKAATNAMEAGFDGIEIHAANGYLFHQFLARCANTRTDRYGGTIENRCRFLLETVEALLPGIGAENTGIRLNPDLSDSFGITVDESTRPTFDFLVEKLNAYNLAYLHLSGFSKSGTTLSPLDEVLDMAAHFRKIYSGNLMINRGFNAQTAAEAIQKGITDMVSFGIPFIANPDLADRFRNNLPMNKADRTTFYSKGEKGYTDYPLIK
ncbi:MAG TPA: alkene reductase [Edaphocola sp.]|nr:alkene reductase [Edaphocola sp.]